MTAEADALYCATAARLQEQISMRLAGNGVQRLVSVMATLATALTPTSETSFRARLALPVAQEFVGQLSGLSRKQTWAYLHQLSKHGWISTARTNISLEGLPAWLALMNEVERLGIECIATIEQCHSTLMQLSGDAARRDAQSTRRPPDPKS